MPKILVYRMNHHEPWWVECFSALAALLWCFFILFFTPGMQAFQGLDLLLSLAPAWVWYTFGIVVPIGQLYALREENTRLRWWLCFVMTWWWSFVGIAVSVTGILVPSMVFYWIFAAMNANSLLRLPPKESGE